MQTAPLQHAAGKRHRFEYQPGGVACSFDNGSNLVCSGNGIYQQRAIAEWNVGCERCHGPGSAHVEHPTQSNILNPAQMGSVDANDTCIQCHSQGRPLTNPIKGKYYDWPVGYHVGLKLQNYWRLENWV